jgi:hypothetical protein
LAIRNNAIFKPIGSQVAHPAVLFRKDIFESAGHYRQGYPAAEDFDLWNRMLRFGKFRNILRPLTNYRQHEAQISIVKRSQQLNSTRAIAIQDLTDSISLQNSNWKFVQTFVFSFRRFLIFNFLEAQALLSDTTTEAELDSRSAKNLLLNRYKKIVSLVVSHPTIAPSIIRALILNLFSKLFIKQYCEKCHEA